MIGNQTKGKSFRGLLDYLESKENSSLIGGNMFGRNASELASEFRISRQLNASAEKVVHHVSLSLTNGEQLDNDTWCELADKYMEAMGYTDNQYAIYRHKDRDHEHIHICASRISLDDGSITSDSWEYVRSEKIIRQLELEYNLQQAPSSREKKERNLSTGQLRRMEREQAEYEKGERDSPPEIPVKKQLQTTINKAIKSSSAMPELIKNLLAENVSVRCEFTRTGKPKGISYSMNGIAFSGTKLGKGYTFPGLQKHSSIKYEPNTDKELITNILEYARTAQKINPRELEKIVPSRTSVKKPLNQNEAILFARTFLEFWRSRSRQKSIKGTFYELQHSEKQLTLRSRDSGEVIGEIPLDKSRPPLFWNVSEEDKKRFCQLNELLLKSKNKEQKRDTELSM